mgnify:CR=1 FL=1
MSDIKALVERLEREAGIQEIARHFIPANLLREAARALSSLSEDAGRLTRELVFTPAFDKRADDPKKNYGIHGVEMRWYVKGPLGAVQFVVYTGWMLDHIEKEMESKRHDSIGFSITRPMPADLGYHSPKPLYEGQSDRADCDLLKGGSCYYDGSTLNADVPFRILKEQGSEAVWKYLENYYHETFDAALSAGDEREG